MSEADVRFVSTGVPGLDSVLLGGFIEGGFYLIQGTPGSGKTTLALQFLIKRARAGEQTLYVSLTESKRDLESTCQSHGWSLDGVGIFDLTRSAANLAVESDASVFHPSETELSETTQAILERVAELKPRYVVFDGISELRLLSGTPLIYRRQMLALKEFFVEQRATVVLLDDRSATFDEIQPESLVSGNLILERSLPEFGTGRRRLSVTKVRGGNYRDGYHDYEIVRGGVVVHPRLVAAEHHVQFSSEPFASGLANLDAMLGGGLSPGSTTLLLGPAGAGKSTIGMQFAVSALAKREKAAVYLFDEVLNTLIERSEKLCLRKPGGIRSYIREGLLHAQQVDPAELTAGAFSHAVRRAVDAGAKVIIIDSLNGYLNSMPEERFLTTHLHELFAYLNQKGIITIIVVAQHGMIIGSQAATDVDVSYLADTVVLFRYFEAIGEIQQAISVFKKRTGSHERTIRQLRISAEGVTVGAPLREFRGIMTGVPRYEGATPMLSDPPLAGTQP